MNATALTHVLFLVAALYDGLLGVVFLIAPLRPFHLYGVPEPNHRAFVQFPAALLLIFALMFLAIARAPSQSRHLIPYGILLKVAYCGLAFGYWFAEGIPGMWKAFAIIDLVMGLLFVWAFLALKPVSTRARPEGP
jgi:hypothetical protein